MTNTFEADVQILLELDAMIKEQQQTLNMNPLAKQLTSALFPGLDKLIPAGEQLAAQRISVLTRTKDRMKELLEQEHSTTIIVE